MKNAESAPKKFAAVVLSVFVLIPSGAIAQVVEVPVQFEGSAGVSAMPGLSAAPSDLQTEQQLSAPVESASPLSSLENSQLSAEREAVLSRGVAETRLTTALGRSQGTSAQGRYAPEPISSVHKLRGLASAAEGKDVEAVFTSRYDGSAPQKSVVAEEEGSGWLGSLFSRLTGRGSKPKEAPLASLDARHVAQDQVPARKLRRTYDEATVKGTKGVSIPQGPIKVIGQPSADEALETALESEGRETNVAVSGPKGSGRTTLVMQKAEAIAAQKNGTGRDIVSVHDFGDPSNLRMLRLEAGQGPAFQGRMQMLLEQLRQTLPGVDELVQKEGQKVHEGILAKAEAKLTLLNIEASQISFEGLPDFGVKMLMPSTDGAIGIVLTYKGEALKEGGIRELVKSNALTLEQAGELSNQFNEKVATLRENLAPIVAELQDDVKALEEGSKREKGIAVGALFDQVAEDIEQTFKGKDVAEYVASAKAFTIKNSAEIAKSDEEQGGGRGASMGGGMMMLLGGGGPKGVPASQAFEVEVLSARAPGQGAKVVRVDHPTYENMIGEIADGADGKPHIKLGALATADMIVVDGYDLVQQRGLWPIVSQALKNQSVEISEVRPDMMLMNKKGPVNREKVPINSKLVLIADGGLVAALSHYDPDFAELFGMRAQFDRVMIPRTPEELEDYIQVVARMVRDGGENLMQLAASGVAKLLEYSSYVAGSQRKLTTEFGELRDVIREAALVARKAAADEITGEHVKTALEKRDRRSDLQERKQREFILDQMMLIDTEGAKVGEINGVAVSGSSKQFRATEALVRSALGVKNEAGWIPEAEARRISNGFVSDAARAADRAASYGHPMKITATHGVGTPGVVLVDEEVGQVGPITQEANGTIKGFLLGRYAKNMPISAQISVKFEQLYGGLEGDSASLAETLVILSDLSGLPIRQDLIITGSESQKGRSQVIGGENFKGPGWWKLVKEKGLTGSHGFVLPEGNLDGLHLPEGMVKDVEDGKFHVYAVRNIDEAIEIFFGVKAGSPDEKGNYPSDTVNGRVQKRLKELFKLSKG